ncbi:MAG: hypothetical protein ACI8PV_001783 [Dinoroseobacter sp.]|jgi:hypothetical protein
MKSIRIFLIVVLLSTICIVNFSAALNGYNRSTEAGNSLLDVRLKSMALMTARLYVMHGDVDSAIFDDDTIFQIWQGDKLLSKSVNAPSSGLVSGLSEYHVVNSVYSGVFIPSTPLTLMCMLSTVNAMTFIAS